MKDIMKTTYKTPEVTVLKMTSTPVLTPTSVPLKFDEEITDPNGFGSREFDYDDEE